MESSFGHFVDKGRFFLGGIDLIIMGRGVRGDMI